MFLYFLSLLLGNAVSENAYNFLRSQIAHENKFNEFLLINGIIIVNQCYVQDVNAPAQMLTDFNQIQILKTVSDGRNDTLRVIECSREHVNELCQHITYSKFLEAQLQQQNKDIIDSNVFENIDQNKARKFPNATNTIDLIDKFKHSAFAVLKNYTDLLGILNTGMFSIEDILDGNCFFVIKYIRNKIEFCSDILVYYDGLIYYVNSYSEFILSEYTRPGQFPFGGIASKLTGFIGKGLTGISIDGNVQKEGNGLVDKALTPNTQVKVGTVADRTMPYEQIKDLKEIFITMRRPNFNWSVVDKLRQMQIQQAQSAQAPPQSTRFAPSVTQSFRQPPTRQFTPVRQFSPPPREEFSPEILEFEPENKRVFPQEFPGESLSSASSYYEEEIEEGAPTENMPPKQVGWSTTKKVVVIVVIVVSALVLMIVGYLIYRKLK